MARLTITLSDERHRQLRMRAAYQGKTIGQLIEEAMVEAETAARARITEILEKASANAVKALPPLSEEELMDLAIAETHAVRRERAARRRPQND